MEIKLLLRGESPPLTQWKFTGFIWLGKCTKTNGKTFGLCPKKYCFTVVVEGEILYKNYSNLILIHLISRPKMFLMQKYQLVESSKKKKKESSKATHMLGLRQFIIFTKSIGGCTSLLTKHPMYVSALYIIIKVRNDLVT